MKHFIPVLTFVMCCIKCVAQTYIEPVFDRTDEPSLHISKIEVTKDTTFVYCTYTAIAGSWARISKNTYLYNPDTQEKFSLLQSRDLPFSPQKREFPDGGTYQILFTFSGIENATKLDFIEDPDNEAFNIYGIDVHKSFDHTYKYEDIQLYRDSAVIGEHNQDLGCAIEYTQKQLDASNYWYGTCSANSSYAMFNLTLYYNDLDNWDKMIEWGKNAIDLLRDLPQDSLNLDVLVRAYTSVGTAYIMKKQIEMGLHYYEESLAFRRMNKRLGAFSYEELLGEMSRLYYYIDNFPKALFYGRELVNFYKTKYEENSYKYQCVYINSLNNLCEFQRMMSKYEEAIETGKQALELIEKGVCDDVLWLKYNIYNNLGLAFVSIRQMNEAITFFEKITNDSDTLKHEHNDLVLNARMLIADIHLGQQQDTVRAISEYKSILQTLEEDSVQRDWMYTAVLERLYRSYKSFNPDSSRIYLKRELQVTKDNYGEESVVYTRLLSEYIGQTWMVALECSKKDPQILDTLYYNIQQITKVYKRHINSSIFNMSKAEREHYWNRPKMKDVFTWLIPTISGVVDTDEWNSLAYDAALFYKGVLLASEVELKKIIEMNNDITLSEQYSEFMKDLALLEEQYSIKTSTLDLDSLKYKIHKEEYALSQKVSWLNKQYKGTNITWQDVRDQLGDNDAAIEFVSFTGLSGDYVLYYAYVIKKNSIAPKLIPLFRMTPSRSVNYDRLSEQIWGNSVLQEELQNVGNIYFSPSGLLNTIGIEYLPITEDMNINDKYNLYRLSSTRELCLRETPIKIKNACLYGGLDYNNAEKDSQNTEISEQYSLSRSVLESLVLRGDFEQLSGSEQEIKQVEQEMSNKDIDCSVYMGTDGTESSFKNKSGTQINIIHLSTHGMYVPTESDSIRLANNFRFILSEEDSLVDEETKALSRSFIVMSGGNTLIHREEITIESDDGILTASEISRLFFPNLDLVVLSACQTALGMVDYEGVYGLQRGFKKAGANTILMSLDKVDDEATTILMIEFYKNLMSGKSKLQSLKDAQKYLREYDNGKYDKPEYWASFIMLDGLN